MIVWDYEEAAPDVDEQIVCWRSYVEGNQISSLPRYLESQADKFRAKYLAFIHELSEKQIAGKPIVDHFDAGDGFSYWWMGQLAEKSPFKSPRIYDCLRLMALEEILAPSKPIRVNLHSPDRILAKSMRRLCENLRIPFFWIPGTKSRSVLTWSSLYRALPYSAQGLLSLRHVVWRWALTRLEKPNWFSGEKDVFFCSYFIHLDPLACNRGEFSSRQWGVLPNALTDSGSRTNWIQHFLFSPVVPETRTGLRWLRQFNRDAAKQGNHAFLETYLAKPVLLRALAAWVRLNITTWRLRNIQTAFYPKDSATWLWPLLRHDWLTSTVGPIAMGNCLWIELFDSALGDIPKQKTGLYLCENQGWEMALLRAWRKHGHGRIVGVPHATVPYWHLYYFDDMRSLHSANACKKPLPDCLAVNGQNARDAFICNGYEPRQLCDVEALRYLNLSCQKPKGKVVSDSDTNSERLDSVAPTTKVLILGDMIPASMHRFLSLVETAAKLLPSSYDFVFKPHPGMAVDLHAFPGIGAVVTTESLDVILADCDVVIAANSTSAAVDAFIVGIPVIVGLDGSELNLSPLRNQPNVRFVSSPSELVEGIRTARHMMTKDSATIEFFHLDRGLPRWKRMLGLN